MEIRKWKRQLYRAHATRVMWNHRRRRAVAHCLAASAAASGYARLQAIRSASYAHPAERAVAFVTELRNTLRAVNHLLTENARVRITG